MGDTHGNSQALEGRAWEGQVHDSSERSSLVLAAGLLLGILWAIWISFVIIAVAHNLASFAFFTVIPVVLTAVTFLVVHNNVTSGAPAES